jgi:hypothetical protein
MRRAMLLALVLAVSAASCRREEAPRAPRRWDTSQGVFRLPSAGVVAFARPRDWGGGIESAAIRRFMDEWDRAADSLERMGYRVGITFRDTIRFVVWPDSFDVSTAGRGASWGYYFLSPGRRPHLVEGSLTRDQVLAALTRFHLDQRPVVTDVVPTDAAPADDQWDVAARGITRLGVSTFPELPSVFARELEALGCLIPQSFSDSLPHNVTHGSFGAAGQEDWAALCSRRGESVILVHWGGPAQCSREVREQTNRGFSGADRNLLQGIGGGRIGFSRRITTTETYHDHGDQGDSAGVAEERPHDVKLDHDAIEDAFLGKASVVWYCKEGKWIALPGAD